MKNKLNDLIDYMCSNLMDYDVLNKDETYKLIKEFTHEVCENQKLICFENAELERDGYEWEDDGKQYPIYKIDEKSIIDCKNIADEL